MVCPRDASTHVVVGELLHLCSPLEADQDVREGHVDSWREVCIASVVVSPTTRPSGELRREQHVWEVHLPPHDAHKLVLVQNGASALQLIYQRQQVAAHIAGCEWQQLALQLGRTNAPAPRELEEELAELHLRRRVALTLTRVHGRGRCTVVVHTVPFRVLLCGEHGWERLIVAPGGVPSLEAIAPMPMKTPDADRISVLMAVIQAEGADDGHSSQVGCIEVTREGVDCTKDITNAAL